MGSMYCMEVLFLAITSDFNSEIVRAIDCVKTLCRFGKATLLVGLLQADAAKRYKMPTDSAGIGSRKLEKTRFAVVSGISLGLNGQLLLKELAILRYLPV